MSIELKIINSIKVLVSLVSLDIRKFVIVEAERRVICKRSELWMTNAWGMTMSKEERMM